MQPPPNPNRRFPPPPQSPNSYPTFIPPILQNQTPASFTQEHTVYFAPPQYPSPLVFIPPPPPEDTSQYPPEFVFQPLVPGAYYSLAPPLPHVQDPLENLTTLAVVATFTSRNHDPPVDSIAQGPVVETLEAPVAPPALVYPETSAGMEESIVNPGISSMEEFEEFEEPVAVLDEEDIAEFEASMPNPYSSEDEAAGEAVPYSTQAKAAHGASSDMDDTTVEEIYEPRPDVDNLEYDAGDDRFPEPEFIEEPVIVPIPAPVVAPAPIPAPTPVAAPKPVSIAAAAPRPAPVASSAAATSAAAAAAAPKGVRKPRVYLPKPKPEQILLEPPVDMGSDVTLTSKIELDASTPIGYIDTLSQVNRYCDHAWNDICCAGTIPYRRVDKVLKFERVDRLFGSTIAAGREVNKSVLSCSFHLDEYPLPPCFHGKEIPCIYVRKGTMVFHACPCVYHGVLNPQCRDRFYDARIVHDNRFVVTDYVARAGKPPKQSLQAFYERLIKIANWDVSPCMTSYLPKENYIFGPIPKVKPDMDPDIQCLHEDRKGHIPFTLLRLLDEYPASYFTPKSFGIWKSSVPIEVQKKLYQLTTKYMFLQDAQPSRKGAKKTQVADIALPPIPSLYDAMQNLSCELRTIGVPLIEDMDVLYSSLSPEMNMYASTEACGRRFLNEVIRRYGSILLQDDVLTNTSLVSESLILVCRHTSALEYRVNGAVCASLLLWEDAVRYACSEPKEVLQIECSGSADLQLVWHKKDGWKMGRVNALVFVREQEGEVLPPDVHPRTVYTFLFEREKQEDDVKRVRVEQKEEEEWNKMMLECKRMSRSTYPLYAVTERMLLFLIPIWIHLPASDKLLSNAIFSMMYIQRNARSQMLAKYHAFLEIGVKRNDAIQYALNAYCDAISILLDQQAIKIPPEHVMVDPITARTLAQASLPAVDALMEKFLVPVATDDEYRKMFHASFKRRNVTLTLLRIMQLIWPHSYS